MVQLTCGAYSTAFIGAQFIWFLISLLNSKASFGCCTCYLGREVKMPMSLRWQVYQGGNPPALIRWFCEFYEGPVVLVLINKTGFGSSSINQTQFQSGFGLVTVNLDQKPVVNCLLNFSQPLVLILSFQKSQICFLFWFFKKPGSSLVPVL